MQQQFTRSRLFVLANGYVFSQAIACAAELGIADKLRDGPLNAAELANATQCSRPHLERLMRALCTIGVFKESDEGFALTPLSHFLRKDVEGSLWPAVSFHGKEMYAAFGKLMENIREGVPAWEVASGIGLWQYLAANPDRAALFDSVMRVNHESDVSAMVRAYDFSGIREVVDVGGGNGSLLREILTQHAFLHGVLFDNAEVVERARESPEWASVRARCRFAGGDFFAGVPAQGDLYILRHVLHDWEDDQCARLLERCRESMAGDARILIIESVLDTEKAATWAHGSDLGMMAIGGRERTSREYTDLLGAAGFTGVRTITVSARVTFIEARAGQVCA